MAAFYNRGIARGVPEFEKVKKSDGKGRKWRF
jgi:hypothetical protein